MMGKLLIDSVVSWATHYKIDSFRFDLMAHQPRAVMERLQKELAVKTGRFIPLLGEGWNFGEVANGAHFIQASQLSLNGTGIASFSDRARDALRGGSAADSGVKLVQNKGYINGYINDPARSQSDVASAADMVKVGLAGSLRDYVLQAADGSHKRLEQIDYHGQPAGYVSQPGEVVNYVENHDNQTLFDINVYKLPVNTSRAERARVQMLGSAITALSQGIAYFHAGQDLLRSKSLDRNSFDSGDWFNRLDWRYRDNYFGTGLPPEKDNAMQYSMMRTLLKNQQIKPTQRDIVWTKNVFRDFLKIRASSTLFRMPNASDIQQRLRFAEVNVEAGEKDATLIAMHLDGHGYTGAHFQDIMVVVNVARTAKTISFDTERGKSYRLHPIQAAPGAADKIVRKIASYRSTDGQFLVPAQSVAVFVQP
jgi:pullulanase-type alpha-1,6-glucosidase